MSWTRNPRRSSPRRRVLALAFAGAVVGVVEALALEVHRGRVQHALDLHAGLGVLGQGLIGERLENFEGAPIRAAVLVDWHWHSDYRSARLRQPVASRR